MHSPTRAVPTLAFALAASLAFAPPAPAAEAAAPSAGAVKSPANGPAAQDAWDKVLEDILAKEGISLGGMFRSQYLHSSIGGPGASVSRRSEESVEFTSVDFDLRARPNTLTQGRLVFRMHQDWRNFFSDVGNPITSRWISIDGKARDIFRYNLGDFRQRYSPLTLHSPDLEVMYEPGIFAARRREAMSEQWLGNNDRLLQGANLNLDAALEGSGGQAVLRELHLNLLGARLRNVETNIQGGSKPTAFVERSNAEKFAAGANADLGLPFGLGLGGTHLRIFDKKGSYTGGGDKDTAAQHTSVWAARGGLDVGQALGWKDASLSFSGEYALSADDTSSFIDDSSEVTRTETIDGAALRARLQGGWRTSGNLFGFRLGVGYLRNEPDYRNELAQSPTFIGERVMNLENDSLPQTQRRNDVHAPHYTSFDAMYRHVFKFAPSEQTNLWHKAPFSKNSYTSAIMTQSEMAAFEALRLDPDLQLIFPFGPATPNRAGLRSDLTLSAFEDKIELQALYGKLDQVEGQRIDSLRVLPKTAFTQLGGGLKLEVGGMFGLALPLTLSGSLVRSGAENAGIAGDSAFAATEFRSDFLNAGLRYQFWKRASLLAGWQRITSTTTRAASESERIQENLAGGLEYKVAEGAYATLVVDRISRDPGVAPAQGKFSQLQTDLFLTVRF